MLDMRFFRNPRFSAASGAVSLTFFSLFGSLFLLTQYLQSVHGFSPLKAGAVVIPQAAMMMMMAPLSTVFVRRFGNKLVVGFGLVVVAVSLGAFGLLSVDAPLWQILVITLLMGVGMGNVMAPATDSIMGSLPRAKAGVGSAMNDTTRQTGGAIGVAVLGSILASKFHSSMSAAAAGHHLPATVSSAIHTDIGSALTIAHTPTGAPFAQTIGLIARESFVTAFHLASYVGAAVIVLAAAAVFIWLPARAADEEDVPVAAATPAERPTRPVWDDMEPAFDA